MDQPDVRRTRTGACGRRAITVSGETTAAHLRLMAISLIQEGLGDLHPDQKSELERFERDGLNWREYVIHQINGAVLPAEFVLGAIHTKWKKSPHQNRELFTRQVLTEWGLL